MLSLSLNASFISWREAVAFLEPAKNRRIRRLLIPGLEANFCELEDGTHEWIEVDCTPKSERSRARKGAERGSGQETLWPNLANGEV
jgi:hypothetical protein